MTMKPKGRTSKTSVDEWIGIARKTLVNKGIVGVRVDKLAGYLGVTRGGFYHNFADREDLLSRLLDLWERDCQFLPSEPIGSSATEAANWLKVLLDRLIDEDDYDPQFDLAVREWARSDRNAASAVERVDAARIAGLTTFFSVLGYAIGEAAIRARVLYFHQIGFYAIGIQQSPEERRRNAPAYTEILCGERLDLQRFGSGTKRASDKKAR